MDRLVAFGVNNSHDYVRFVDGTCKHWAGQFVTLDALWRLVHMAAQVDEQTASKMPVRPFAHMRQSPTAFNVGLYEHIPSYSEEKLVEMPKIAATIHVGGERAEHSQKGALVGDVSIGRYLEIYEQVPEGAAVLDIASGNGYGSSLLAERASSVIGVDLSVPAVMLARQTYGNIADFRVGSATNIPVEDNSVDAVVSIATIEHIPDDRKFVQEINRVLKPGGICIIYTPQNSFGAIPTWPWHEREYSIAELSELFEERFAVTGVWGWQNGRGTRDDPRGDGTYLFARKR